MTKALLEIAIFAIAVTVFKMIIPENTFKKQMNFTLSSIFLLGIILFMGGGNFDVDQIIDELQKETNYINFSETINNQYKREIAGELSGLVRDALEEEGIAAEEISVIINISEQGSISINEIRLVLPEGVDADFAEKVVKRVTGAGIDINIRNLRL